jgi:hypothetical protein
LQLYLVFHVSLLKLVLEDVVVSNKEIELNTYNLDIYNIKKILDSKVSKRKIEYLVKWLN